MPWSTITSAWHATDTDLGSILGTGFPAWIGGALSCINTIGLPIFVAEYEELAAAAA
jgi:hypothetical protein